MISEVQFQNELDLIIKNAIREDVGDGDHSSLACIPTSAQGKAKLLVKDEGIIAGVEFAEMIFKYVDQELRIEVFIHDGEVVKYGDVVFQVSGSSQSILKAERLVLNSMQRMSAIATKTKLFVDLLKGANTKILDTRKTTPLLREVEKMAVKLGGGHNHRFGLYDMVMIKDNHIDMAGGLENALHRVKAHLLAINKDLRIEVEVRSMGELEEALNLGGFHRIMLDNFSPELLALAVKRINGAYETESSGGITEATIKDHARSGVDYISVGALTHNIKSLDLSLKAF